MRPLRKLVRGLALSRRVAAALGPHARGEQRWITLGAFLTVLLLAFRLAQPWPLKWIIDGLTGTAGAPLGWLALGYVALTLAAALCEFGQRMAVVGLGNRIVYRFRRQVFATLLAQPLTFHDRRGSGELLTRVVYDTSRLRRGVTGILLRIGQTVLLFLATVAVLVAIHPGLGAVVSGCGLLALVAMAVTGRRILSASRASRRREGKLAGVVEENLRYVRDVQTYGLWDDRFETLNQKSLKGEQKVRRLEAALLFRVELLLAIGVCLVLWLGSGTLTPGDLVLFVTYTVSLYRPFTQFARQAAQSGKTAACAERLLKIMDSEPLAGGSAPFVAGSLELESVSVKAPRRRSGKRKWALREISLRIAPGERIAVMGSNGAGKSTLLRLIARLQDPDGGRLLVDGRPLAEYDLSAFRRQISVVYQDAAVFTIGVERNVALARPEAPREDIARALERAGASALARRSASRLSAGERQRVALARAMLRNGAIWLLDEPTTGLDAEAAQRVGAELFEATRGRTTMWVTHDRATALRMDRVLVLRKGRVTFFGTAAEYCERSMAREA